MKIRFCIVTTVLCSFFLNSFSYTNKRFKEESRNIDTIFDCNLFISKSLLKFHKITSIKIFTSNCDRINMLGDSAKCYIQYIFSNGMLKKEMSFDELKIDSNMAEELAYSYYYKKDYKGNFLLDFRNGDAYNGYSQLDHINKYIYVNSRL